MKVYLGDSVYADWSEHGRLILTTHNGYPDDPRNIIILDPEVFDALLDFVLRMKGMRETNE
jgi:hypothetical protein